MRPLLSTSRAPGISLLSLILVMGLLSLPVPTAQATATQEFSIPGFSGSQGAARPGATGELATVWAEANFQTAQPGQQIVVAVVLDVEPGYHAQSSEPIQDFLIPYALTGLSAEGGTVYEPVYPEGEIENYPALVRPGDPGDLSVYTGRAVTYVPVEVSSDVEPGTVLQVAGQATYQICDDQNCFAPKTVEWGVEVEVVSAAETPVEGEASLFEDFDPSVWSSLKPAGTGEDAFSVGEASGRFLGVDFDLDQSGLLAVLMLAFVAGMVFNVVPCVLPVLPLKAMSFYEVAQHNRARCIALGVAFSAGIVLTFAALAVLVLVLHAFNWGELFSRAWFAGLIALILVAMALFQFGAFSLALPGSVYAMTPRHDTYTGNVLFGILTAILSTPCTFGLFFALLTWASAQPVWIGVPAVTVTGVGMAFPYLVLSAFPGLAQRFPRSGAWSELVKQVMGFLLLAIAAYFVRPLLPEGLRGLGWWWVIFGFVAAGGLFAIVRAVQLSGGRKRPVLITALIAAIVVVPVGLVTYRMANPPAGWVKFSPEAFEASLESADGPVLVKFTADWCANCQTVEQTVFGTQASVDAWHEKGLTLIKADLTNPSAEGWGLLRELNPVGAIPFTAVYFPERDRPVKLSGIYGADDLLETLERNAD